MANYKIRLNIVLLVTFMVLSLAGCQRESHQNTGLMANKLKACPNTPNCVQSSDSTDESHYMKPWKYSAPREITYKLILQKLEETNRVRIASAEENYIHAVFSIPLFGFKDDVEFYFPGNENTIYFRSASRVGHSDLGVNKRRMNTLRKALIRQGTIIEE